MDYNVVITSDAEKDLDSFIHYLLFEKKNEQAASSVLDDFEKTKQILSVVAGSLNYCANSQLKRLGYKRLNFQHHRYFMLFRLVNNLAIVDFPVPLAPTIAILAPLFICNEKCSNTGLSGSYPKDIF